ncbi:MAG: GEVED domain-containing protein [Candidatus Zixiibacteriota bacterium]
MKLIHIVTVLSVIGLIFLSNASADLKSRDYEDSYISVNPELYPQTEVTEQIKNLDHIEIYMPLGSTTASPDTVPPLNCSNPYQIVLENENYITIENLYTCGLSNIMDNTCLGNYDGGEEMIIELLVIDPIDVDILIDPKGTTYTGIALSLICPLDTGLNDCVDKSTNSAATIHGMVSLHLEPNTYYIIVDTWPSPACIPDFDLIIQPPMITEGNDMWQMPVEIAANETDIFTTIYASFDGPGNCMTSPNIWYCYSALSDGIATASLCGSSFDTKIAVFNECNNPFNAALLACNDDFCGVQSEIRWPIMAGTDYMIEIGGHGNNSGSGILSLTFAEDTCARPPNDNCEEVTPVSIGTDETITFEGTNYCASHQCSLLDDFGQAWEAFSLTDYAMVTINYCGTNPPFEIAYKSIITNCPCEDGEIILANTSNWSECSDGNITMTFFELPPGTYYIPILANHPDYPNNYYEGDYVIHVTASWISDCPAWGGCDEYIANVSLGEINNNSSCDNYGDYTNQIANLTYNESYPIRIDLGSPYSGDRGAVWIDWNQDYTFDPANEIIDMDVSQGNGPYIGNLTVPPTALAGSTIMRVRLTYNEEPLPCGYTTYGEVEDYTINILAPLDTMTILIEPNPIYAFMQYPYNDTLSAIIYLGGNFDDGNYDVSDINLASILINNNLQPQAVMIVPEHPDFTGEVAKIIINLPNFIGDYPPLWDTSVQEYIVSGLMQDDWPFLHSGEILMIGHTSGDANFDGTINILDVTYLINYLYKNGYPPKPISETGDANGDGNLNILDVTRLIGYLYKNGEPPIHP